jgi:hypothetical protein
VLRLIKVFKYLKSLRRIVDVIMKSSASFLAIASLLVRGVAPAQMLLRLRQCML